MLPPENITSTRQHREVDSCRPETHSESSKRNRSRRNGGPGAERERSGITLIRSVSSPKFNVFDKAIGTQLRSTRMLAHELLFIS